MPSFHQQERAAGSELGTTGPDGDLTNSTKQESGTCLLAKDTLLTDGTLAPLGVCSVKPPYPFFPLGLSCLG